MCGLRNIAMRDYQESVTTGQTDRRTETDTQTPDKMIPMCRFASQATQKFLKHLNAICILPLINMDITHNECR